MNEQQGVDNTTFIRLSFWQEDSSEAAIILSAQENTKFKTLYLRVSCGKCGRNIPILNTVKYNRKAQDKIETRVDPRLINRNTGNSSKITVKENDKLEEIEKIKEDTEGFQNRCG